MLHVVTLEDRNQSDSPYMVFAVHAPENTPRRVIQQACIDAVNADVRKDTLADPEDIWDGQLDDPATTWDIRPVEPVRLSVARVAQYEREILSQQIDTISKSF